MLAEAKTWDQVVTRISMAGVAEADRAAAPVVASRVNMIEAQDAGRAGPALVLAVVDPDSAHARCRMRKRLPRPARRMRKTRRAT